MTHTFEIMKNGKTSENVWANAQTREIYPANNNSFGFNAEQKIGNEFWSKYGKNMKYNQGKADYTRFYYSEKSMNEQGFILVRRGSNPLW
jgi:hypothetical protein